jgi:hypothetical protein
MRFCRHGRPDDPDALGQSLDDQIGLTDRELSDLVLVDPGPGPHGHGLPAGQLLAVDRPGALGDPLVPARAASSDGCGVRDSRMAEAAASSRAVPPPSQGRRRTGRPGGMLAAMTPPGR